MDYATYAFNGCFRKKVYKNSVEANKVIEKIKKCHDRKVEKNLKPYKCKICSCWHIGHSWEHDNGI